MRCPECQKDNLAKSKFCSYCGASLEASQIPPEKSLVGPIDPEDLAQQEEPEVRPGSLRDQVAFLSGRWDQAKAKVKKWQSSQVREEFEESQQRFAEETTQGLKDTKNKPISLRTRILSILVGLTALAVFIWILMGQPWPIV